MTLLRLWATDEEKSRIRAPLLALKNVVLQQLDGRQHAVGFMKRYPGVKTIRYYGIAFCRSGFEVAMK